MDKVMVFGGQGMVGRQLKADFFLNDIVIDLDKKIGDVTDPEGMLSVMMAHRPDAVINLAAFTDVDGCERDMMRSFLVNSSGAGFVAMNAEAARIPYALHVSTDYVFGLSSEQRPYVETDPMGCVQNYGHSKMVGEISFMAGDMSTKRCVVRSSWLYGDTGRNFPLAILDKLRTCRDPKIAVVDDQIGSPTYAKNLCHFLQFACKNKLEGIWHFADAGYPVSRHTFAVAAARMAHELTGLDCYDPHRIQAVSTMSQPPKAARRPVFSGLDCTKAHGEFRQQVWWDHALFQYVRNLNDRGLLDAVQ